MRRWVCRAGFAEMQLPWHYQYKLQLRRTEAQNCEANVQQHSAARTEHIKFDNQHLLRVEAANAGHGAGRHVGKRKRHAIDPDWKRTQRNQLHCPTCCGLRPPPKPAMLPGGAPGGGRKGGPEGIDGSENAAPDCWLSIASWLSCAAYACCCCCSAAAWEYNTSDFH